MWSLWDGKDILNEIDPRFAENIEKHIHRAIKLDPFHGDGGEIGKSIFAGKAAVPLKPADVG